MLVWQSFFFFNVCDHGMLVLVRVCVCACVHAVCTCVCVHVEARNCSWISSSVAYPPYLFHRVFHWPWGSLTQLDWIRSLRAPRVSHLPSTGIADTTVEHSASSVGTGDPNWSPHAYMSLELYHLRPLLAPKHSSNF